MNEFDRQFSWRPILRRLVVFWIPEKARIMLDEKHCLYLPNRRSGSLTSCQAMWVFDSAKDCKLGPLSGRWARGTKCYVHDGLEMISGTMDLEMWEQYKDFDEFYDLKVLADKTEGKVHTGVVSEGSVIATEDTIFKTTRDQERYW